MSNKISNYNRSRSKIAPRHPDTLAHKSGCQQCIKTAKEKAKK